MLSPCRSIVSLEDILANEKDIRKVVPWGT